MIDGCGILAAEGVRRVLGGEDREATRCVDRLDFASILKHLFQRLARRPLAVNHEHDAGVCARQTPPAHLGVL